MKPRGVGSRRKGQAPRKRLVNPWRAKTVVKKPAPRPSGTTERRLRGVGEPQAPTGPQVAFGCSAIVVSPDVGKGLCNQD